MCLDGDSTSFIFFFYWRYNPLWVLAFSVIFFHSALSSHCFLHRLTHIICKSSSMPAIHLFLGLPLVLVPIGFHCNILLGVLLSSIRITWPSQAILLLFYKSYYICVHFIYMIPETFPLSLNTNDENISKTVCFYLQVKTIIQTIFGWFGFQQLLFGLEFSSEDERKMLSERCVCVQW